jgi:CubicO group peptidase (beta-lactamase class C family)
MQLVDEGLLDLDLPVVTYLPSFRVADPDVTEDVTARHLLAHTSGIDGDLFLDTGRGDDAIEKYVAGMAGLKQLHPLGATMSYCNSGYMVLGRIVEVLRGQTWEQVLRERIFTPLELEAAGTLPEEALLWGAATGHLRAPNQPAPVVTPIWGIFRGGGPAGLIHSRAIDVVTFARLHLADGVTRNGVRVLSESSARAMREPQVAVPDRWTLGSHWGLGWILMDWDGRTVYGHDGATYGQAAFLRVLPAEDGRPALSVALAVNGGGARELFQDLFGEVFAELAGVAVPEPLQPASDQPAEDLQRYVGRYARESVEMTVESDEHGVTLVTRSTEPLSSGEPTAYRLVPCEPGVFLLQPDGEGAWMPAVFFQVGDQQYLHLGARATPRDG